MLDQYFKLTENGTSVRTEIIAGVTTFLTLAYIMFVNPSILAETGMDHGAVFVATCLAAAVGTIIMGVVANYPVAVAPGMGLNAYFAFGVVLGMGHSWQVGLGAVFLSGIIFVVLSILPVREWIINAIPDSMKRAISAGIGLFLAIIALKNAGWVVDHSATLVTLGDVSAPPCPVICGWVYSDCGVVRQTYSGRDHYCHPSCDRYRNRLRNHAIRRHHINTAVLSANVHADGHCGCTEHRIDLDHLCLLVCGFI